MIFRRKQQQDAHELLCCLLDGMASEEKENKKGIGVGEVGGGKKERKIGGNGREER